MTHPTALLLPLIPLVPMLAGLLAVRMSPAGAGLWATRAAGGSFGLSCLAALVLAADRLGLSPLAGGPGIAAALRLDAVSVVMALLVSFVGHAVIRFSRRYLAGDPRQPVFFARMSLTLAAVLTLVLAGNLLLLAAAWIATSMLLHLLLLHRPERAGAVFSARKKFVVSRLGDLCLLVALGWIGKHYGSWDLGRLFDAAAGGDTGPLPGIGLLLAACAALKSAQFPFHSWLPDTMETPTPVSAFMHAGIINAGGFLVIRLSPLFVHAPAAMALLAVVGALTAALGAVVMLAQPSVKRSLAWSTIAQMGFMLLQCGLGAFGLALLHLVAHSLYKAHAFLSAGSTIGAVPRAAVPLSGPVSAIGFAGAALAATAVATAAVVVVPAAGLAPAFFGGVLVLALSYGLIRCWAGGGPRLAVAAGGAAVLIGLATIGLHAGVERLAGLPAAPAPATPVLAVAAGIFVLLFVFQLVLWRAGRHPLGRSLYVHALNGFYVGTFANRLLGRFWPRKLPAATGLETA